MSAIKPWIAQEWDNDEVHVYPLRDLTQHEPDDCICGPSVEAAFRDDGSNGWVIVHHSLDGREARERS